MATKQTSAGVVQARKHGADAEGREYRPWDADDDVDVMADDLSIRDLATRLRRTPDAVVSRRSHLRKKRADNAAT